MGAFFWMCILESRIVLRVLVDVAVIGCVNALLFYLAGTRLSFARGTQVALLQAMFAMSVALSLLSVASIVATAADVARGRQGAMWFVLVGVMLIGVAVVLGVFSGAVLAVIGGNGK
jgi:hypothetical protein